MTAPDYLVVGHVAKDITPKGHTIGGTVTYSAVTAQRLGLRAAIVTAADSAFGAEVQAALPGIALHNSPSAVSTTFQNTYTDSGRVQMLLGHAGPLTLADIPAEWRSASIVHLGPLAQEFDGLMVRQFPDSLVAITPQGWLRQWDTEGHVRPCDWPEALDILPHADVLIFSPEDVGHDWNRIHAYTCAAPLAVLTLERHGALVFHRDEGRWLSPREARVVDPTGAGDVFAAAFLSAYAKQRDPYAAARFANVAASFSIEGVGIASIPDRATVENWLVTHPSF